MRKKNTEQNTMHITKYYVHHRLSNKYTCISQSPFPNISVPLTRNCAFHSCHSSVYRIIVSSRHEMPFKCKKHTECHQANISFYVGLIYWKIMYNGHYRVQMKKNYHTMYNHRVLSTGIQHYRYKTQAPKLAQFLPFCWILQVTWK